ETRGQDNGGTAMTEDEAPRRISSLEDRNAIVESALDKAIRRGDFDDLPGLGKPLSGLHNSEDPDWWIKQRMDSEDMSGVAPAAFQLRKENAVLEATLDAFSKEADVRAYLAGFNDRVRAAIMDLREGPPVFTPPRKVEDEVAAWRQRRSAKTAPTTNPPPTPTDGQDQEREQPPRRWWQRKRS
ncbi:MAG: DUF1992 domain-containing protein, partial [Brevibacterium aurantiacum]